MAGPQLVDRAKLPDQLADRLFAVGDRSPAAMYAPPNECGVLETIESGMGEPTAMGEIAMRKHESRAVEIDGDLEAAIDSVRECRAYKARPGVHFYVVSQKVVCMVGIIEER
jgi:hypothetical protein